MIDAILLLRDMFPAVLDKNRLNQFCFSILAAQQLTFVLKYIIISIDISRLIMRRVAFSF